MRSKDVLRQPYRPIPKQPPGRRPAQQGEAHGAGSGSFPVAREAVGSAPEDRSPLAVLCCFVWKSSVGLFPLRGMCFACLLVPLQ